MKVSMESAKTTEIDLQYDPAIPPLEIFSNEVNPAYEKVTYNPIITVRQSVREKICKQPRYPSKENGYRINSTSTSWNSTQLFKK